MDVLAIVAALLVAAITVVALRGAMKKERRESKRIDDVFARARGHGWKVERALGTARWRLAGGSPGGSAWTMDYDGDALSSNPVPTLTWRAPSLGSTTQRFSTTPLEAIRILCRDPSSTTRSFDDVIEDLVARLPRAGTQFRPGQATIARHPGALEIAIRNLDGEWPVVERVVRLGEALADRIAGMPG